MLVKDGPFESHLAPPRAEVAVIGGGVVGLAAALELARRGKRVVVLERGRIGEGCSFGNAGWLTASLSLPLAAPGMLKKALHWLFDPESPLYIQPRWDLGLARWLARFLAASRQAPFERGARAMHELALTSLRDWEELAARSPEPFGYERRGLVAVYETPAEFAKARAAAERARRHGMPYEVWSAAEVREREPAVVGAQVGAYYFPNDAHCDPYLAVCALAAEARRSGVTIVEEAELFGVERRNGSLTALATTRGSLAAAEVVLATGASSERIGALLGVRLPILGGKGYTLRVPRLARHPERSIYLAERKVAINPQGEALRISGTLELVREDLSINRRRVDAVARAASAMLDLPRPLPAGELWRGLRPCAPDGMPVIGRARGLSNLWIATGHQMTGLKCAPASARLLADLMTGAPPAIDPEPFRADRF